MCSIPGRRYRFVLSMECCGGCILPSSRFLGESTSDLFLAHSLQFGRGDTEVIMLHFLMLKHKCCPRLHHCAKTVLLDSLVYAPVLCSGLFTVEWHGGPLALSVGFSMIWHEGGRAV